MKYISKVRKLKLIKIFKKETDSFVKERVQSGKVNLWSPMKKRKLLTWKTSAKVLKVTAADKILYLLPDYYWSKGE